MNKTLNLLLIFIAYCNFGNAQVNKIPYQKTHSIGGGISVVKLTDQKVLNKQLTGTVSDYSYRLSAIGYKRKTNLSIAYSTGLVKNSIGCFKSNKFLFELADAINVIKNQNKHVGVYIGYSFKSNPGYLYSNDKKTNIYNWFTVTNLSLYQSYHINWKKQSLSFDIKVPLIGFVNRPTDKYDAKDAKNINSVLTTLYQNSLFTSLHNYQAVETEVIYQRKIIKNWNLNLGYSYFYEQLKTTNKIAQQNHSFKIGVGYSIN
jgi:hypothetical protein